MDQFFFSFSFFFNGSEDNLFVSYSRECKYYRGEEMRGIFTLLFRFVKCFDEDIFQITVSQFLDYYLTIEIEICNNICV